MHNYLYIVIVSIISVLLMSVFFRYGWILLLLWLLFYIGKIIKGLFVKEKPKSTYSQSSYYEQDDSKQSTYHQSTSQTGNVIDADYTVVEEEETR